MTIYVGHGITTTLIDFNTRDELDKIKAVFEKHGVGSSEYEPSLPDHMLPNAEKRGTNEKPARGNITIHCGVFDEGVMERIESDIKKLAEEQLKTHEQTNRQTNNVEPSSGDAAQGAEGPPTPK